MKRIAYTKPSITELEVSYATDAAQNGWGERCYDYINRFEAEFRQYVGTEYAIATSSCTGSLHIGMAGLGIGDGDEVIVADTNYIAAIAPIVHLGATPVFLDVLPDTWCLDVSKVEASTPRVSRHSGSVLRRTAGTRWSRLSAGRRSPPRRVSERA